MILPLESFLPEASLERLRAMFGSRFDALGPTEIQTLVTAEAEGKVSNARMRMVSNEHAADLARMFQGLVAKGFLEQVGQKRGASFPLPRLFQDSPHKQEDSPHKAEDSPHKAGDSTHKQEDFPHKRQEDSTHNALDSTHKGQEDSTHNESGVAIDEDTMLLQIAAAARMLRRLPQDQMRRVILDLCTGRFLTPVQIGALLNRNPNRLRERFLAPMAHEGLLLLSFPQGRDLQRDLEVIKSEFASVTDFERDFPSLCFALATGVGKTRLSDWRSRSASQN